MTASDISKLSLNEYIKFVMNSAKERNMLPCSFHYDLHYQYGMIGRTRYMEARTPIGIKEMTGKMQKDNYLHRYYTGK